MIKYNWVKKEKPKAPRANTGAGICAAPVDLTPSCRGDVYLCPETFPEPVTAAAGFRLGLTDSAKRIGLFFASDGGCGHMAGIDLHIIGQLEQLGADAIDQGIVVASGKIGASDGAGE